MTVPTHFRLTFRGIFQLTPEIWSFHVKFNRDVDQGPDAGVGDINQGGVTDAITTLLSTSGAAISSSVKLTDWRAYVIGTDGKMEGNPLVVDTSASSITGQGTNRYPPQVSLCVTTVATNRGPARFGRFYLPGPAETIASDCRLSTTAADAYAAAAATFLKDISDAIDLPGTIASSAGLHVSPADGGVLQVIDHVEVGRVLDTIRSRRNALVEDRQVRAQIDW